MKPHSGRKSVYVAGPFTGDVSANCLKAINHGDELWRSGTIAPFIPHLFREWGDIHHKGYEEWMEACFHWLAKCDALYRIPGASSGADREVEYAQQHNIPVFTYVNFDKLIAWSRS